MIHPKTVQNHLSHIPILSVKKTIDFSQTLCLLVKWKKVQKYIHVRREIPVFLRPIRPAVSRQLYICLGAVSLVGVSLSFSCPNLRQDCTPRMNLKLVGGFVEAA